MTITPGKEVEKDGCILKSCTCLFTGSCTVRMATMIANRTSRHMASWTACIHGAGVFTFYLYFGFILASWVGDLDGLKFCGKWSIAFRIGFDQI